MFIVDKKGLLRSVKARGQLETLIPALLAEQQPPAETETQ